MQSILRFLRDEQGQDLTEYALVITLIAAAVIVGVTAAGTALNGWYNAIATQINTWTAGV